MKILPVLHGAFHCGQPKERRNSFHRPIQRGEAAKPLADSRELLITHR